MGTYVHDRFSSNISMEKHDYLPVHTVAYSVRGVDPGRLNRARADTVRTAASKPVLRDRV